MNTTAMKWVDGVFGPRLCWLQSLFYRKERPLPAKVEKILIVKMFGLGSIILMSPMIRSIRKSYPNARLYFITFKGNASICRYFKVSDDIFAIRRDNFWNFILDTLSAIRRTRREKIDIIIDAEFFSQYTALFTSLLPHSFHIGFFNRNVYRGRFLDRRCYFNQYYHIKDDFMQLANVFCSPSNDTSLSRPEISRAAQERIRELIQSSGFSGYPITIFNPQTSDITPSIDRSWPLESFAEFGRYLLKKGYAIAVIGDPRQTERAQTLADMCGEGARSFAGKTDIEGLICLVNEAFCVVTNDSAPLHIAASLNIPTMGFFGTDTPGLYGHPAPLHMTFYKRLFCSPCLSIFNYKKGECEFNSQCLRSIASEEVISGFQKNEEFLKEEYYKRRKIH